MAGTGDVGGTFVRYLYMGSDPCIIVQNLVPGGRGKISAEKKICSLEGKSFYDYMDVDFKEGVFKDGKLFLEIGVTQLRVMGEKIKYCEVVFRHGVADHLSCRDKKLDYDGVVYAGTGSVAGIPIVRYLAWSEDACILIQNMIPRGRGEVSAEKKICSLEGASFYKGSGGVDFKEGVFRDGKLFFELGVIPLDGLDETIKYCEVVFDNGVADHLSCKDKAFDHECNS